MKFLSVPLIALSLGGCAAPHFVGDTPPIQTRSQAPDHFELPARFAFARVVYGRVEAASDDEAQVWENVATRSQALGTFAPLAASTQPYGRAVGENLAEAAREQRFDYLLVVTLFPGTARSEIELYDTASGGLMATAQSVSSQRGQNGFWGGRIKNPNRLERVTLRIARDAAMEVEELLHGVLARQN